MVKSDSNQGRINKDDRLTMIKQISASERWNSSFALKC